MYRACRVRYHMTPQQMEMALIDECLSVGDGVEAMVKEEDFEKMAEMTLEEIVELLRKVAAYSES